MTDEKANRPLALLVLAAATVSFSAGLGAIDLWAPDEPRYAQIAEELRSFEHGLPGTVLLHLNGEVYSQKPPLYFWLAALAGLPGGRVSEAAARLPAALAGIACVLLTLGLGRRLLATPLAATLGAAVLVTTFRFAHQARRAQLDVLLCAFELVAMLAFVRIEQGAGKRHVNLALLHGAMGLGVLTKGPVALLPLAVAGAFLAREGRLREIRSLVPGWGLALSLAPGLLWISLATLLAPAGYAGEAVFDNTVGRFFSGTDHVRPFYYFLYQLPADFLPWTLALPLTAGLWAWRTDAPARERSGARLLATWVLVHFVFFSLSAGKRGVYLLPAFPALALLCGAALDAHLRGAARAAPPSRALALGAAGLAALSALATLVSHLPVWPWPGFVLPPAFGVVGLALAAGIALAFPADASRGARLALLFGTLWTIELAVFRLAYPAFDPAKSPRPVAELAAHHAGERGPIGVFEQRALAGGIAYYAGRPVRVLTGEDELVDFVAASGSSVVARRSRFEELDSRDRFTLQGSLRHGARELVVATPRAVVSNPARP